MADATDAIKASSKELLHDQHDEWRRIVTGLDSQALNWKPGDETNSITVLVSHALDAERSLAASAVGVTVERDRESHFQAEAAGPEELLAMIDRIESEVDGHIDRLTAENLAGEFSPRPGASHTGAWWLQHALEHSREHVGQALLTRQMYEQRT